MSCSVRHSPLSFSEYPITNTVLPIAEPPPAATAPAEWSTISDVEEKIRALQAAVDKQQELLVECAKDLAAFRVQQASLEEENKRLHREIMCLKSAPAAKSPARGRRSRRISLRSRRKLTQ
jgi:septal ring factor EnvC (AmiA/AmiB activator)